MGLLRASSTTGGTSVVWLAAAGSISSFSTTTSPSEVMVDCRVIFRCGNRPRVVLMCCRIA